MPLSVQSKLRWSSLVCVSLLLAVFAILTANPAEAGAALKVTVPWDRTYLYWIGDSKADGAIEAPGQFKGKRATLDIPDPAKGQVTLTVHDITTGNEAVETIKAPIDAKGLTLQKRDFDEVRRVRVKISADKGKPVRSAVVKLKDISGRAQTVVTDPTVAGVAEFTDVTAGDATVDVLYGDGKRASQEITVPEERDDIIYATEVPVAGPVATIAEPKESTGEAPKETSAGKKAKDSGFAWVVALIGTVLGFFFLVGAGVVALSVNLTVRPPLGLPFRSVA
jgi:hypothetical protein